MNIKRWHPWNYIGEDPLVNAIQKYEGHPSTIEIKDQVITWNIIAVWFKFFLTSDNISEITTWLEPTKKTCGAIPKKLLSSKQGIL